MPATRSKKARDNYEYLPVGQGTTKGARPETHYRAFKRLRLVEQEAAEVPEHSPGSVASPGSDRQAQAEEGGSRESEVPLSPSSPRSPSFSPRTPPLPSSQLPTTPAPPTQQGIQDVEEEIFNVGDVVYLPSSYQAPHVGVLTHLWTLDDRFEDSEVIYGVVRLLHWPDWMSTMARKRMEGLTTKNEIFYTHKAPKVSKRRTKTSTRSGQSEGDFEAGPALHDYSFEVSEILSKVRVWPDQAACERAVRELQIASRKINVIYRNRSFPLNLFCERAVDPNRELFWRIRWDGVVTRGTNDSRWDLVDEEKSQGDKIVTLQTEGQRVNEVIEEICRARGIDPNPPKQSPTKRRSAIAAASSSKKEATPTPTTPSKVAGSSSRSASAPSPSVKTKLATASRKRVSTNKMTMKDLFGEGGADSESEAGSSDNFTDSDDYVDDESGDEEDRGSTAATSDEDGDTESDSSDDDDDDDDDFEDDVVVANPDSKKRKRKAERAKRRAAAAASAKRFAATDPRAEWTPRKGSSGLLYSPSGRTPTGTPRSKARILGIKRAKSSLPHPSLPARPPKISSLTVSELSQLSPQARAKRLLHVGATPDHLPCREDQYEEVMACVEDAVEEGIGGCVYVSGVPGTGKTATVREVIRALTARAERNEMNPFSFVEINGMKTSDASQAYSLLWSAISGGQKASPKTALNLLSSHFNRVGGGGGGARGAGAGAGAGPGRAATVVLMDELDQLVTTRQDVMYNLFNWPNTRGSRLVVIAVANTMDLPERALNPKVASRLGMTRITFMPYTDKQLVRIVQSRLGIRDANEEGGSDRSKEKVGGDVEMEMAATKDCDKVFSPEAITYVSKRVSNVSGDARRMLDVCRRAIELVEAKSVKETSQEDANLEVERTAAGETQAKVKQVTLTDMRQVLDSMVKSGKVSHIVCLPLHSKILLLSLLACQRRSGIPETSVGEVYSHHSALCRMHGIDPFLDRRPTDASGGGTESAVPVLRTELLHHPLASLCSLGLVIAVGSGAGSGKGGGHARIMLACQEDEIRLALESDGDERIRKML